MHFADLDHARVDLPPVQRGPHFVGRTAHTVADDDVLVRLWIPVTVVVMVEYESGHSVGRDAGDAPLSGTGRRILVFEILDGHFRGLAHAFVDAVSGFLVSERPEDADAFRLACGQVESGDGRFPVVAFAHFDVSEVLAVGWVASFVDEGADGFAGGCGADFAADEFRALADPNAWWIAGRRVVGARVGWVQRVVTVDRFPRVTEWVFGVGEFGEVHCHGLVTCLRWVSDLYSRDV